MKKSLFLCIICLVLQAGLVAQTYQACTLGIGAVSDSSAVLISIGQPYCATDFGFASLVNNSVDSLLCYNIGEIPDITVTPGIKTRFEITWQKHWDAVYSCSGSDYSYDTLITNISPTDNGVVFQYTPAVGVFNAFKLVFRAKKSNDSIEQIVTFNPVQVLQQEFGTVAYTCNSFLMDTIVVNKSVNNNAVVVIGSTVVFAGGSINNGAYVYKGTAANKLDVYATNVMVRDSVALPGCELTIYCENLSFETNNACFDIQPVNSTSVGENTKNMNVYAKNYAAPGFNYRFRLRGGQGVDEKSGIKAMSGGDAGNFTSNLNLREYVNLEGGYTGNPVDSVTALRKGKEGQYIFEPSVFGWLHPVQVRFALGNVTNQYIHGLDDKVINACEKYINMLDAYKKSNEYDTSSMNCIDLLQLYNSFITVRDKIMGGYDYFGNPKSWAPLLSFESNKTMYDNEIDYALRVLYLHYLITGISSNMDSTKKASAQLTQNNADRVALLQALYEKAKDDYPSQKNKFLNDCNSLFGLDSLLNAKLDSLYARAEKIIANKNKWRGIVYTIGNVCSCIPGMNHYGIGLKGIAQMDYNDPFTSENLDVASESLKDFVKDMTSKTQIVAGIYKGNSKSIKDGSKALIMDALNNLKPEAQKESQKLKDQLVMPIDEVEAKFEKLKASLPQIDEIADSMKIVSANKGRSWEALSYSLNVLNNTSGEINQLLASNNALNNIINNNTYDARAISVLSEMEKDAWATLLKYHYYLARAYQYRFLEPYDGDIDMRSLFDNIVSIAKSGKVNLSTEQFGTLKSIFEGQLRNITSKLFDRINKGEYSGTNASESYSLSAEELNTLNSKGEVTINLWQSGSLPPYYSDARLTDFEFSNKDIDVWADTIFAGAKLNILLQHSGKSMFVNSEDGMHYLFDQYTSEAARVTNSLSPIGWGFKYDFNDGTVSALTRSVASQSLIKYMLGNQYSENNILIYSLPSAWADITIRKVVDIGTSKVSLHSKIKKLQLNFKVDFEDIGKKDLANIIVKTNIVNTDTVKNNIVTTYYDLAPVIQCNKPDVNGLTQGKGSFTRTYPTSESVVFTAPQNYGNYSFSDWLVSQGGIVNHYYTNTITVSASKSRFLSPEYKQAVPQISTPDTIWADYKAQSIPLHIYNKYYCDDIPMDWSISENSEYLSISNGSESGTENSTVMLQLSENPGLQRTSRLNICSPNSINPFVSTVIMQKAELTDVKDGKAKANLQIKLKPNPATSLVTVTMAGIYSDQQVQYSIIDMQGRQILFGTEYIQAGFTEFGINTEQFSNGIYTLLIITKNKEMVHEKLIINK